jgi:hypothetical protein
MDVKEFFELSAGKWFSQRTSHHLAFKQSENGKSEIVIETLPTDHPEVVELCKQYDFTPDQAMGAARITWAGTMQWDEDKEDHSGTTVMVPIPDAPGAKKGKLLRSVGYAEKAPAAADYIIGDDDAFTLITEYETMYSEERIWFASPNLRLRTSILKRFGGFSMASFCSEIRMGVTK